MYLKKLLCCFYGILLLGSCSPLVETSEEFPRNATFSKEQSIAYLNKLINHDANNADALFQLARLELEIGQTLKSKEDIMKALSEEPDNIDYLILKAKIDDALGQHKEAVSTIENILERGGTLNTVENQIFATNLFLEENNLNQAEYYLSMAAQSSPELPEVLFNRARLYTFRHDTLKAARFYEQILKKDSSHKGALINLAEIYLDKQKADTALLLLSKVKSRNVFKYNVLFAKGLTAEGYLDSASKFWGQALLLSPKDPQAHFELGKHYYNMHIYQNATAHFAAVPENARKSFKDFYVMYAIASENLSDSVKAEEFFSKAKLLDSTFVRHKGKKRVLQ